MTAQQSSSLMLNLLERMSPRDIAAYYYGTYLLLRDLQELQLAGKRVPGGLSRRIEIAAGYYDLLRDSLRTLAQTEPSKIRDAAEYFSSSSEATLRRDGEWLVQLAEQVATRSDGEAK